MMNMKISYNWYYNFWWGMVKHSQNSQNSKFAMSLQYLKKEVSHRASIKNMLSKVLRM